MATTIELEDREAQIVVALLRKVDAPWDLTNPLIMKFLRQMQDGTKPVPASHKKKSNSETAWVNPPEGA